MEYWKPLAMSATSSEFRRSEALMRSHLGKTRGCGLELIPCLNRYFFYEAAAPPLSLAGLCSCIFGGLFGGRVFLMQRRLIVARKGGLDIDVFHTRLGVS